MPLDDPGAIPANWMGLWGFRWAWAGAAASPTAGDGGAGAGEAVACGPSIEPCNFFVRDDPAPPTRGYPKCDGLAEVPVVAPEEGEGGAAPTGTDSGDGTFRDFAGADAAGTACADTRAAAARRAASASSCSLLLRRAAWANVPAGAQPAAPWGAVAPPPEVWWW